MINPALRRFVSLVHFSEYLKENLQSGWIPGHRDISYNFTIVSTKVIFSPAAVKDCAHQHITQKQTKLPYFLLYAYMGCVN